MHEKAGGQIVTTTAEQRQVWRKAMEPCIRRSSRKPAVRPPPSSRRWRSGARPAPNDRTTAPAPAGARFVESWHRLECLIAVVAFGFIALVLIVDVVGRELLTPLYRAFDIQGSAGIFAAQKLSVFALVIGSFAGIGIATATGSHIVPRFAFGWVPKESGRRWTAWPTC